MNEFKNAIEKLKTIEDYVNAYSGHEQCRIALTSKDKQRLLIVTDRATLELHDIDCFKDIYELSNYIIEMLKEVK